ncbi:MAG: F0F1 ATP synthase subunit delta [Patescibacteria group bacterium]
MKNTRSLIDPVSDAIHTQKELEFLLLSLENFKKIISATSRRRKTSNIFKQLPNNLAAAIQESWRLYQEENPTANPDSFIKTIEKQLLDLPKIQLSTAFQPSQLQAEKICDWLRTKFKNREIIIEIKFNPSLVAGCILEHQGKRYDLSVSTQISSYAK